MYQEAFASASAVSPQLACRLAAPPGHESGLKPHTNTPLRGCTNVGPPLYHYNFQLQLSRQPVYALKSVEKCGARAGAFSEGLLSTVGVSLLAARPKFVVARTRKSDLPAHWNRICVIAAMLAYRVFVHKSPTAPGCLLTVMHNYAIM